MTPYQLQISGLTMDTLTFFISLALIKLLHSIQKSLY
jgi:hypothetical protein